MILNSTFHSEMTIGDIAELLIKKSYNTKLQTTSTWNEITVLWRE